MCCVPAAPAAGKYTLACDTFWSGTSTANLACNLYNKSGSKQTLKLSCDISVRRTPHVHLPDRKSVV